jgi:hypothetical protein
MPSRRLVLALICLVLGPLPALAAECGGIIPCDCGDTVVESRVLGGADPVTSTRNSDVCDTPEALTVQAGVTLDLGGRTIRCAGLDAFQAGIIVGGPAAVTNGTIANCDVGVFGETSDVQVSDLRLLDGNAGLLIVGNGWTVTRVGASNNVEFNLAVVGNGHVLTNNRCEGSLTGFGIVILGNDSRLEGNFCQRNAVDGILVLGSGHHLASNQGRTNGEFGIFAGDGNTTDRRNYANGNGLGNCEINGVSLANGKYC